MDKWHLSRGTAYLTFGVGYGREKLTAFDAAELDAHIVAANAVKVSSFIPPGWSISLTKAELPPLTDNGAFLPMAYAYGISNDVPVAASLAIGVNRDERQASIIMEHAEIAMSRELSLHISETNVQDAFAARGWTVDRLEKAAVEGRPKDGLYVCALVAVVFIVDKG
jgi:arginine decarboxylase